MTAGPARVRLQVEGFPPFEATVGQTLLEACEAAGVPMVTECGGFAACNSCRVLVLAGADALSAESDEEQPFLDADGQRLGCQARLAGGDVAFRLLV